MVVNSNYYSYYIDHMSEYTELGHPYIQDYSLNPTSTWVLAMSPFMCTALSKADFIEVDATFKASLELNYLLNVVCFDYTSMLCKFIFKYNYEIEMYTGSIP